MFITLGKLAKLAQAYDIWTDKNARRTRLALKLGYTPEGALSYCRAQRKAKKRAYARYKHFKALYDAQEARNARL